MCYVYIIILVHFISLYYNISSHIMLHYNSIYYQIIFLNTMQLLMWHCDVVGVAHCVLVPFLSLLMMHHSHLHQP